MNHNYREDIVQLLEDYIELTQRNKIGNIILICGWTSGRVNITEAGKDDMLSVVEKIAETLFGVPKSERPI